MTFPSTGPGKLLPLSPTAELVGLVAEVAAAQHIRRLRSRIDAAVFSSYRKAFAFPDLGMLVSPLSWLPPAPQPIAEFHRQMMSVPSADGSELK